MKIVTKDTAELVDYTLLNTLVYNALDLINIEFEHLPQYIGQKYIVM